ncbi:hypothetical protein BOX15_Mlig021313g1 [Macrostomum lignano]|uniref:Uncharacterized protein n=1 Tax=Macrostomum lignano TaxID=282301 RepID=A0A267E3P2_9PLAT|nr:hypothetical protein BOX15_Mlig021313g1 [Macrostomum lignano]
MRFQKKTLIFFTIMLPTIILCIILFLIAYSGPKPSPYWQTTGEEDTSDLHRGRLNTWGECSASPTLQAVVAVESGQSDASGRALLRRSWPWPTEQPAEAQLIFFIRYSVNASWEDIVQEFYAHNDMVLDSEQHHKQLSESTPDRNATQIGESELLTAATAWMQNYCPSVRYLLYADIATTLQPKLLPWLLDYLTNKTVPPNRKSPPLLGRCLLIADGHRTIVTNINRDNNLKIRNNNDRNASWSQNESYGLLNYEQLCL